MYLQKVFLVADPKIISNLIQSQGNTYDSLTTNIRRKKKQKILNRNYIIYSNN